MGHMESNVVLPYQFNNLILILVCGLVLLWALKVLKNLHLMIQVRNALLLADRMVQIEGMGSYLSYFEGVTETHANSLIHTRQSKPPVNIKSMYVPCILNQSTAGPSSKAITISKSNMSGRPLVEMSIDISVTTTCTAYILFGFKPEDFKRLILLEGRNSGGFKRDKIFRVLKISHPEYNIQMSFLHQNGVCSLDGISTEISSRRTITFSAIPETMVSVILVPLSPLTSYIHATLRTDHSSSDNTDLEAGALALKKPSELKPLSVGSSAESAAWSSGGRPSKFETVPQGSPRTSIDVENNKKPNALSFFGNRINPLKIFTNQERESESVSTSQVYQKSVSEYQVSLGNNSKQKGGDTVLDGGQPCSMVDCSMGAGAFVFKIPVQSLAHGNPSTCWASEFLLVDNEAHVFSSMEIFGLGSLKSPETATNSDEDHKGEDVTREGNKTSDSPDKPAPQPHSVVEEHAMTCGGKFVSDECVVCLTESKKVLLLPCRHLCVCGQCLTFIDKCPVCRATFEEYVLIGGQGEGEGEGAEEDGDNSPA